MAGFQSKRLIAQERYTDMSKPNPQLYVLDADIKTSISGYIQQAEANGADGSHTVAEVLSLLVGLSAQLSSIIMNKDGYLKVAEYAHDKHTEEQKKHVH